MGLMAMLTFWVLFVLAILFVIGSAGAMRYFGNRSLPPRKEKNKDDQ